MGKISSSAKTAVTTVRSGSMRKVCGGQRSADCASEGTWQWGDSDSSLCEGILMVNINKSNKIYLALLMLLAALICNTVIYSKGMQIQFSILLLKNDKIGVELGFIEKCFI